MKKLLLSLLFVAAIASTEGAGTPPGHSYHGEAFNEGPRQAAYLMGGTGKVRFPVTTKDKQARKFFLQGLGQLHGFWYFEAERSFRQSSVLDPDCAMNYWGMAMANVKNEDRAEEFIAKAMERIGNASPLEKAHIETLNTFYEQKKLPKNKRYKNYADNLEKITRDFLKNIESKAFFAMQSWVNNGKGVKIKDYEDINDVIQEVLDKNPVHPAHHYRIHLWDKKDAARALESAAKGGPAAPSIAHMWHMPNHIYSKLHRYHDAVWQQEASARVDHAHMMRDRVMPDQIHNYAHNNEWLSRNLSHIGRVHDAIALARNMCELPRHPAYNHLGKKGSSSSYGRNRLMEILVRFEMWDDLLELSNTSYLAPHDDEEDQLKRLHALAVARYHTGDSSALKSTIDELEKMRTGKEEEGDKAVAKAVKEAKEKAAKEEKNEEETKKAVNKARLAAVGKNRKETGPFTDAINELRFYQAFEAGDMKRAGELADDLGAIADSRRARIQWKMGNREKAIEIAEKQVKDEENEVEPLALLAWLQFEDGKQEAAEETFGKLRKLASAIDLDLPVFQRLSPLAKKLDLPSDWRLPKEVAKDLGKRPDLDSLGPLHWSPSRAHDFTLKTKEGKSLSLSQYQGKPVILIFYLGYGCSHCLEQLNAFKPETEAFRKLGVELVGISTDTVAGLKETFDGEFLAKGFPFPLAADPELKIFKQYRCYDDFEKMPLHGTFLVDSEGKVRWQDISFEPFTKTDFLLKEAQRLLYPDQQAGEAIARR